MSDDLVFSDEHSGADQAKHLTPWQVLVVDDDEVTVPTGAVTGSVPPHLDDAEQWLARVRRGAV